MHYGITVMDVDDTVHLDEKCLIDEKQYLYLVLLCSCVPDVNNFTCICLPGFTDVICATRISDCSSQPCQNGGNCSEPVSRAVLCIRTCSCIKATTCLLLVIIT